MSRYFQNALHTAFVVPEIEKEIDRLLAIGIGPVFVMSRIRVAARYRGVRHDPLMTAAFAYSGDTLLEFLQPLDNTPSGMLEFLERNPAGGLHHFAYFSDDFAKTLDDLRQQGADFEVVQEYIDQNDIPYEIYIQATGDQTGLLVQLVNRGPLEQFYNSMCEIAADWDGSDPVRAAAELLPLEMRPTEEA